MAGNCEGIEYINGMIEWNKGRITAAQAIYAALKSRERLLDFEVWLEAYLDSCRRDLRVYEEKL